LQKQITMGFKIKSFYSGSPLHNSSPLHMEDAKLMAMKKQAAKLKQEIAAMRAESKKTGKVTNWDDKSDQLSRLNEQIAAYKPKKS